MRANMDALRLFAAGAEMRSRSGHAAGQVVGLYGDAAVIDFGESMAWFRAASFPEMNVGDFVTVGPAVTRWGVILKETDERA